MALQSRKAHAAQSVPQEFLDAIAGRDWERLAACFAPDVTFRALTPPALRDAASPDDAAGWFRTWWEAADPFELIASEIVLVRDRVRIGYRIRLREEQWVTVEQQAYCKIGDAGIEIMDLVCTGDRPD